MLTPSEIDAMQATTEMTLIDRCTIQRKTVTRDGFNDVETWTNHAVNVPCRFFERTGVRSFEGEQVGREQSSGYPTIRVPSSTDVNEDDRIVIGTRIFDVTRCVKNTYSFVTTVLTTETR